MRTLEGRTVVLLEARMGEEAAALVRKFGGTPYPVPAVREVDQTDEAPRFRLSWDDYVTIRVTPSRSKKTNDCKYLNDGRNGSPPWTISATG
jgi:hypothetical protein